MSNKPNPINTIQEKLRSLFGRTQAASDKKPGAPLLNFWTVLIIFWGLVYLQQSFFAPKTETIPYSRFKQAMAEGSVDDILIGPEKIEGILKGVQGQKFVTVRVNDPGLAKEMDERKIQYSSRTENRLWGILLSWVLPLGFLFLIWRFTAKNMGGSGGMPFGKNKAKIVAEGLKRIILSMRSFNFSSFFSLISVTEKSWKN